MNWKLKSSLAISALVLTGQAFAQVTFYEYEDFRGRAFKTSQPLANFKRAGSNDRASSVIVERGRWEVCEDVRFGGRCVVLRPGNYDSLRQLGMDNKISSVRPVSRRARYDNATPEPIAAPAYEYRRRPSERVYEAPVTSARAIVGPPEERCWMERQQVETQGRDANVGAAIIGGIIGGILGHQVGEGSGKDVATAGGAVVGAVIGSRTGGGAPGSERDVRRCESRESQTPAYWDVTYRYRGVNHRVQMNSAPGRTISVNRNGEPRQ